MIVPSFVCKRCSMAGEPHHTNSHLCVACVKAEDSRVSYYRQHNFNWMDVAKEADLELWMRQPAETDWEYTVWTAYRDAYPGKSPTYRDVATDLNTSVEAVKKIGARWSFAARLQAWAKHVDNITLAERTEQIKSMNKRHIRLAEKISAKLEDAVDKLDTSTMTPKDVQGLLKVMTDVERRARIDNPAALAGGNPNGITDDNPEIKKDVTPTGNMAEIVAILTKTGALNLGVRQTVTTEVVVKDD